VSVVVTDVCGSCNQPVAVSSRAVVIYWPRTRGGVELPPLVAYYCSLRCSQVAHQRRRGVSDDCRPWCVSVAESNPNVCDCLEDAPDREWEL
jgi:hypothetical protein